MWYDQNSLLTALLLRISCQLLYTALKQNINQRLLTNTPHSSRSLVNYEMFVGRNWETIDCVIMAPHLTDWILLLQGHTDTVSHCGFCPGGTIMAAGSACLSVASVWMDTEDRELQGTNWVADVWRLKPVTIVWTLLLCCPLANTLSINPLEAEIVSIHCGRVTRICIGNLNIIGSDNGLSPGRR